MVPRPQKGTALRSAPNDVRARVCPPCNDLSRRSLIERGNGREGGGEGSHGVVVDRRGSGHIILHHHCCLVLVCLVCVFEHEGTSQLAAHLSRMSVGAVRTYESLLLSTRGCQALFPPPSVRFRKFTSYSVFHFAWQFPPKASKVPFVF